MPHPTLNIDESISADAISDLSDDPGTSLDTQSTDLDEELNSPFSDLELDETKLSSSYDNSLDFDTSASYNTSVTKNEESPAKSSDIESIDFDISSFLLMMQ